MFCTAYWRYFNGFFGQSLAIAFFGLEEHFQPVGIVVAQGRTVPVDIPFTQVFED